MKKKIGWLIAGFTVLVLNGCGNSTDVYVDPGPELVSLFLVDDLGVGVEYVPYTCVDSYNEVVVDDVTNINGEFTFAVGDRCTFDLYGFAGDVLNPLYIADIDGFGKDDIPYSCDNRIDFTDGVTDFDGWFAYPVDAHCKFYF